MTLDIEGQKFLTSGEAVKILNTSRETLSRYVKRGLIKKFQNKITRTTYYLEEDVKRVAAQRSTIEESE